MISESTANRKKPVWGFWATFGFGFWVMSMNLLAELLVMMVFIIVQVSAGETINIQFLSRLETNGLMLSLATIFGSIASLLVIIFIIRLKSGSDLREYLALRSINWRTILILLGIVIVFIISFESLAQLINYKGTSINEQIYKTVGWPPLFWLMAVVFAPLFEEVFFRGFLFEGFVRSPVGLGGALFFTSLSWAILHIQYGIFEITAIFILGLIIGLARYLTGSLWSAILIHAVFNLASTIAITIQGQV